MNENSTALIASNLISNNQNLALLFNRFKITKLLVNTKESIIPEIESYKPDYLFITSNLAGVVELLEVIPRVKQISPKTKIVFISTASDKDKILNYVIASTDAVIRIENLFESLEVALKQLAKEQMYLCGSTLHELKLQLQKQKTDSKEDSGLLNSLTDREVEVLYSLTQGVNYKQISKLLFISESTVKTHINNIFTKLNVNDRTQAVLYALHHGIKSLTNKPHILKNLEDLANEPLNNK